MAQDSSAMTASARNDGGQRKPPPRARDLVAKSVKFDRPLAGAVGAWADGAGVDFSEAVRRLCAMGLASWPGNAFSPAPAAGAVGKLSAEIKQARDEVIADLREAIEDAADEVIVAGRKEL